MAAPYHHLTLFPPMGVGASYLFPSLAVSLLCLIAVLLLRTAASPEVRRRMAPLLLCFLSLSVILSAMAAWSIIA